MDNQKDSEANATKAAVNAALKTVAIGGAATLLLGSPIGWGLTAYYAYTQARRAYRDSSNS